MRGVTIVADTLTEFIVFQLTRLMRGVTLESVQKQSVFYISTHTPHARRDRFKRRSEGFQKFQLTRLMRGVTP